MSLSWLAPIDTSFFTQNMADPNLPASNPNSAFYVPPPGTYQNDAGQIVPISQPNTPVVSTPTETIRGDIIAGAKEASGLGDSDSLLNYLNPNYLAQKITGQHATSIEEYVVIIVGVVLIAAGLFAFKTSQTIIQTGTNVVRRGRDAAAAIVA